MPDISLPPHVAEESNPTCSSSEIFNERPSSSSIGNIDGVPIVHQTTTTLPTSVLVEGNPVSDAPPQVGTTHQQHRFDVYNKIQTSFGTTSVAVGVGILKIASVGALLGANAPLVGIGLVGFGSAALLNAATDRFFRPHY